MSQSQKPLAERLYMKPGQRAAILNAPKGYEALLEPLPQDIQLDQAANGDYDFVHLFVRSQKMLQELAPVALTAVKIGGTLWISYPKKKGAIKTDITRDIGWEPVIEAGWRGVRQVSIDDTWSALMFKRTTEE